jgi:hypothetical protein
MVEATGRRATVVLVRGGEVLGQLPPVSLEMPWWPEAHDLVAAVRQRDGIDITVLRLLRVTSQEVSGGEVTYLAETDRVPAAALHAYPGDPLHEHPLRQVWARPGGPTGLLSWADGRLAEQGVRRTADADQMRTWNLSALWRLPTTAGRIWLKVVPDFFAHEGAVINWIGAPVAPVLHGFASGRALIGDIEGVPNHEVLDPQALRPMVDLLTSLQRRAVDRVDELLALGVPDRRLPRMLPGIASVVEEWGSALRLVERRALDRLLCDLPARVAAIAGCGVPDTLVHGDFHAGNVAGPLGRYVILDWGDSFVGHPLIDELAFVERLSPEVRSAARGWFVEAWEQTVPGSDPGRAVAVMEPLLSLLAADMYARFCAGIEPDERAYHSSDVVPMLRRAADQERQ